MVRDDVMTQKTYCCRVRQPIVAFVTYWRQDATASQQVYGYSNLATFGKG
jgi:hypothetical protein